MRALCCDSTDRVAPGTACTGWSTSGYPWHGCSLPPGHDKGLVRSRTVEHVCKCGHGWSTR